MDELDNRSDEDARTCQDCHAHKHSNCLGSAWDNVNDEPCACACWETGHAPQ